MVADKPVLTTGVHTVNPIVGTGYYRFTFDNPFVTLPSTAGALVLSCDVRAGAPSGAFVMWGLDALQSNLVTGANSGTSFVPAMISYGGKKVTLTP